MAKELIETDIPEGKIIDFIDGKARPDSDVEQIRQNFERTLVEEYRFDKSEIGVDVRITADPPLRGAENMARDEAMLASGEPAARLYGWRPACVSLGRAQILPYQSRFLAPRDVLLVLDNCEHVIEITARDVDERRVTNG